MLKLLIVADDFTGALDTGIQFSKRGISTRVVSDRDFDFASLSSNVEVLVINAETRHLNQEESFRIVGEITRRAVSAGTEFLFKKTDSALRGNTSAELAAMLEASGTTELLFMPAHPTIGRITRDGIHYINDVPVAQSVFGKDPFEPVTISFIPDLFKKYENIRIRLVSAGMSPEPDCENLKQIAIFDADNEDDMRASLLSCKKQGKLRAFAGCAGLAAILPEFIPFNRGNCLQIRKTDGFLAVCGSLNPITLQQLDCAEKSGFERIHLTKEEKLVENYLDTPQGNEFLKEFERLGRLNNPVIIDTLNPDGIEQSDLFAKSLGYSPEQARKNIAYRLGDIVKRWLDFSLDYTVFMTGGDTLIGFIDVTRASDLIPICEVSPGTVVSHLKVGGRNLQVISKSGGFGDENVLIGAYEAIKKQSNQVQDI